jgi:hypothetical protein
MAAGKDRERVSRPLDDDVDDGRLERGGKVEDVALAKRGDRLGRQPKRGLQAGEREVGARPAEADAAGRSGPGRRRVRPSRSPGRRDREAEQLRRLVEGLAEGVVDGGAEAAIVADAVDGQELAVAAGDQEEQIRKRQPVGQPGGERVALEVVDGDERLAGGERDRLGVVSPTSTPPIRPGPAVAATRRCRRTKGPPRAGAATTTPSSASTWARAAISGTTPPKAA